jgi:hypothetical protein
MPSPALTGSFCNALAQAEAELASSRCDDEGNTRRTNGGALALVLGFVATSLMDLLLRECKYGELARVVLELLSQ